jgi:hypothetical protein
MPIESEQRTYGGLYPLYSKLYFALGQRDDGGLGDVLPTLIAVAQSATSQTNQ